MTTLERNSQDAQPARGGVAPVSLRRETEDQADFDAALRASFERTGFAVLSDHGIPQTVIDDALAAMKAFFALDEATIFLREAMDLDLSASQVSALEKRTEGWIAGLQLAAPDGDSVDKVAAEIAATVNRYPWIDMIVCPELGVCGTDKACAEPLPGPREQSFRQVAKQHGIWLLPGSFHETDGERIYNTTPVISPDGEVVTRHRKLFPWRPYEIDVTPGEQHTVFDVPGVARFGVSICYDMWFPEAMRTLAAMGAECLASRGRWKSGPGTTWSSRGIRRKAASSSRWSSSIFAISC